MLSKDRRDAQERFRAGLMSIEERMRRDVVEAIGEETTLEIGRQLGWKGRDDTVSTAAWIIIPALGGGS